MREYRAIFIGLVVGIVMGWIGGPAWIVLPWGAIAIALAYDSKDHRVFSSGVFGFTAGWIGTKIGKAKG